MPNKNPGFSRVFSEGFFQVKARAFLFAGRMSPSLLLQPWGPVMAIRGLLFSLSLTGLFRSITTLQGCFFS